MSTAIHSALDRRAPSRSGYTLIEAVLLVVVLSVIGLPTSFVMVRSSKVYARALPYLDISYQTSLAVERMQRDIRALEDTGSISRFGPDQLAFVTSSGEVISYELRDESLLRNQDLLAHGVSGFAFRYWRRDGHPALAPDELHLVEIDLTLYSADQKSRLRAAAYPRAFGP